MRLEPDKHLHSKEHLLADDLSRMMAESKKFAAYLGIAKLYYESDLRGLARRVMEKQDLPSEARGKYFFAALRGLEKKPGVKFTKRKKTRKMAKVIAIVKEPEKVLRKKAKEVGLKEIPSPKIQGLILNMKETLKNTPTGVGLAAPQAGESFRIFIVSEEAEEIDRLEKEKKNKKPRTTELTKDIEEPSFAKAAEGKEKEWKYYIFINPIVKKVAKKKLQGPEGCLSVPEKYGLVRRAEKITVGAYDENGKKFTRGFARFFARVIQHELDHLEGVLFIDKADKFITADESR